jgi:hypothetical protein
MAAGKNKATAGDLNLKVYIPPITGVGTLQSNCDAMTPEQRAMAVERLEKWTPGQCERSLLQ